MCLHYFHSEMSSHYCPHVHVHVHVDTHNPPPPQQQKRTHKKGGKRIDRSVLFFFSLKKEYEPFLCIDHVKKI